MQISEWAQRVSRCLSCRRGSVPLEGSPRGDLLLEGAAWISNLPLLLCQGWELGWAPGEQPECFCYWDNGGKLQLCGDLSKENTSTVQLWAKLDSCSLCITDTNRSWCCFDQMKKNICNLIGLGWGERKSGVMDRPHCLKLSEKKKKKLLQQLSWQILLISKSRQMSVSDIKHDS